MSLESILDGIVRREGGYVDHPADRGGPTRHGITAATLGDWRGLGRPATRAEVLALDVEEARAIYRQRYVVAPGFDRLVQPVLLEAVVDYAVHSGPAAAARALQYACEVRQDGIVGPVTLAAANRGNACRLRRRVLAARLRHLGRLIAGDPSQAAFAAGWLGRVAEQVEEG